MWRSEDEMLEVVVARAEARRRRRQLAGTATGVTVVLAVALISLGVRAGDRGPPVNVASSGGATGTPSTTRAALPNLPFPGPFPTITTTIAPPSPATIAPPSTRPATTVPLGPASTTTSTAAPTTLAATTTPIPLCPDESLAYTLVTDKAVYQVGETVEATATLRNTGPSRCHGASALQASYATAAGAHLIGMATHYDCFQPTPCGPILEPGQTQSEAFCWDQRDENGQVPSGAYAVTFTFGPHTDRVPFEIAPGPSGPTTTRPPGGLTLC